MNTDTITEDRVITIDYGMSFEDMIAAGKYDWVTPNIIQTNFPVKGQRLVELETKVFHFDPHTSSNDGVAAIQADDRQNPWAPATIEGLLAYGAKHPEEQLKHPIIGLGSVAKVFGDRLIPCLSGVEAKRGLILLWWDDALSGRCRFLAVRKWPSTA